MINRVLAFSGIVLFIAFVATPSENGAGSDKATDQSSSSASSTATQSSWYAGTHTLERSADGHFYANIDVNGTSMRMLVDTGASVVALTESDAIDAGLSWDADEVGPIGRGASGTVYGVPATIDRMEIGGIAKRNVQAIIIPQGLDVSLLGQSFLGSMKSVEIVGEQMALEGG